MAKYINKEELLDKIKWEDDIDKVIMCIAKMPTIKITPVQHGKWLKKIVVFNGHFIDFDYVCSICEESGIPTYKFCPHCGARMNLGGKDNG